MQSNQNLLNDSTQINNHNKLLFVSANYNGQTKSVVLKFYDMIKHNIFLWTDNTNHKPYCYTNVPPDNSELQKIEARSDIIELKIEKKRDLLKDSIVNLTKIIATNPLAIGGSNTFPSIRDVLKKSNIETWESDIKYYENYIYDKQLIPGAVYEFDDSKFNIVTYDMSKSMSDYLDVIIKNTEEHLKPHLISWASLLSHPIPDFKRIAVDIEVFTPEKNRIPDPKEAKSEIISCAIVGDDIQEILLLKRSNVDIGKNKLPENVNLVFFDKEYDLISNLLKRLDSYPFIISFNGDNFDFQYIINRAKKLGFQSTDIPILLGKEVTYLKNGIHIDLYKTFSNRSMQIYAFGNKYSEHTLDAISKSLLGKSKINFEGEINDLTLYDLAYYNYHDSLITYNLTSFDNNLLMKLLVVVSRIAKMPIDDVSRLGVSNWIRSMLYFEHRKINALIPKKSELRTKGDSNTEAMVKGKKYKGGLVVEPKSGIFFDITVLDFASLYPSIIKVHNLSYETVRCLHNECKTNLIPETDHWICKKQRGITSLIIGSLRDLRVNYYKRISGADSISTEDQNLYTVIAQALKVILNASYGVMGAEIFPLYCLPVADATTAIGRFSIKSTIKKCQDLKINVVYGDTDSIFLENPSKQQIDIITNWSKENLGIELDFDKHYRYVAFSKRKKNYLGIYDNGNVDIKGLTGKKSHTPPFIKNAFYDTVSILSKVKTSNDFETARAAIKTDLKEKVNALKQHNIPIKDLAFRMMLSKPLASYKVQPQHVQAASQLQNANLKNIKSGDIIFFIKTVSGVKPLELSKENDVDVEKYISYLRGTFDQILDSIGYDFDELLGATKIEDFFWS